MRITLTREWNGRGRGSTLCFPRSLRWVAEELLGSGAARPAQPRRHRPTAKLETR